MRNCKNFASPAFCITLSRRCRSNTMFRSLCLLTCKVCRRCKTPNQPIRIISNEDEKRSVEEQSREIGKLKYQIGKNNVNIIFASEHLQIEGFVIIAVCVTIFTVNAIIQIIYSIFKINLEPLVSYSSKSFLHKTIPEVNCCTNSSLMQIINTV